MQRGLPEALGSYAGRPVARFHMPGHKGRGMGGFFRPELIGWDITELSVSDNLGNPQDVIGRSQDTCAKRYGAKHTFFLVNGSTAGIHAMLLALPQGARLLIGRDCHRAVLNGAALSGHECSFVEPAYIPEEDIYGCVTADAVAAALKENSAEAVIITSPNYYGLCADLEAISAVARAHGSLLFVDAAHGAHFPFSKQLPQAPAGYADAWVSSAHKTLNALGQAAMLHIGERMDAGCVQRALSLVQTSSPSYLLLSSLDWACYTAGLAQAWDKQVAACKRLAAQIGRVLGLHVLGHEQVGQAGIKDVDPTRLVIDVSERGITGFAAAKALERQDVFVEMADVYRLVCICTPADDPAWYHQLIKALEAMPYGTPALSRCGVPCPRPQRTMPLHVAARAKVGSCLLQQAAGRVAADTVGIYPPGVPVWTPGERITEACIAYLLTQQHMGADLFGVQAQQVMVVDGRKTDLERNV